VDKIVFYNIKKKAIEIALKISESAKKNAYAHFPTKSARLGEKRLNLALFALNWHRCVGHSNHGNSTRRRTRCNTVKETFFSLMLSYILKSPQKFVIKVVTISYKILTSLGLFKNSSPFRRHLK